MSMFYELALKGGDYMPWNEFIPLSGLETRDDHESDMKHLLIIVEDIMERTIFSDPELFVESGARLKTIEDRPQSRFNIELFTSAITNMSRELTSKPGENEDEKTLKIIKSLSNYSLKTKVTLALAAFTIKYGKLRLLGLLYASNPLARTVALLKQQPDVPEYPQYLKSWLKAFAKLMKTMLELTKSIIDYKETTQSDSPEKLHRGDPRIQRAAYWTISSVVVCSSQIMAVLVMRRRSNLELYEWNLDDLNKKLSSRLVELLNHPQAPPQERVEEHGIRPGPPERTIRLACLEKFCLPVTPAAKSDRYTLPYQKINSRAESHVLSSTLEDEQVYVEGYEELVSLFHTSHSDNMDILKAFFYQEDQPLLDGSTKERVSMDVLKSKSILLFISDLDLRHEEIVKFDQVFTESRQQPDSSKIQYEVIWLPVVDTTMSWKEKSRHFETILLWMPWYSVYYPSLINQAAIKYIKEVWQFNGKPLAVALDPQGKVVNHNALHMIRVWGSRAFPFTRLKEETLWMNEIWRIELVVDSIDPMLSHWIAEDKHICLYGGEDQEWIRGFTTTALKIASIANIALELLYIGTSCPKDMVQSCINIIVAENLSHVIQDLNMIKFFWIRLESMLQSRVSITKSTQNDPLTEEIKILLSFDKDEKAWALISQKENTVKANGQAMLKCFMEYDLWKDNSAGKGFVPALSGHLHELQNPPISNHPESPQVSSKTPPRSNSKFLWRSLSCFAEPPTN